LRAVTQWVLHRLPEAALIAYPASVTTIATGDMEYAAAASIIGTLGYR
jgi:hypothetical protein